MGYMNPEEQNRIKIQDNILTISYLDEEKDPGMYQCRASNTLKTRYCSAQLRVLCKCFEEFLPFCLDKADAIFHIFYLNFSLYSTIG